ncbi:MAG: ASKHA domain-containing protein [Chloroflexota bacterium]
MRFEVVEGNHTVQAPTGALLSEVARQAGFDLNMPCGGQGRCGRCAVIVKNGAGIRRRSTVRLTAADLQAGYALACQTVIEGDAVIVVPPQEKIERRLVTDKTAGRVTLPFAYSFERDQSLRLVPLALDPPTMGDQTDDWSRLKRALNAACGLTGLSVDLEVLRRLGAILRAHNWQVTAVVELDTWDRPHGPPRLVDLLPPLQEGLWGAAVDIGTTTVSLYLVNLRSGEVLTKTAEYNGQIKRGEDVISRIIYAGKNNGLAELQGLVVDTINELVERACQRVKVNPAHIYKMTVAGNSTMIHLFLGLPANSIRLEPFVTTVNQPPPVRAGTLGLNINPQATVDCLPGVASYVGADISAGVVGSQMCASSELTLFLDVGTNGEMVLGDCDWLISCACSAGPAFEGAGVQNGMRATNGAIEEVWINNDTHEPSYRVIPHPRLEVQGRPTPPRGICGSGLISLLSEMFITGVIDKGGNLNFDLNSPRIRKGEHGPEYVIAWANETEHGRDIAITKVDIDNLMRAKGAIYAGFSVLAQSIGVELEMVERVLIGGSFGQYINVEKAVQIGLLPDMAWHKFHFLGNTSLQGALLALLNRDYRQQITEAAAKMTYVELSADNTFYDAFTSALFLPHTDLGRFPSVVSVLAGAEGEQ